MQVKLTTGKQKRNLTGIDGSVILVEVSVTAVIRSDSDMMRNFG